MEDFYKNTPEQIVDLEIVQTECSTFFVTKTELGNFSIAGENHFKSVSNYAAVAFIFPPGWISLSQLFCHWL